MRKLLLSNVSFSLLYILVIATLVDITRPVYDDIANGLYVSLTVYAIIKSIELLVTTLIYNKNVDKE